MIQRLRRIHVYNATKGPEDGAGEIAFTISNEIIDLDVGEQVIYPLDGRAERIAGQVAIVDKDGVLTAELADVDGYPTLGRRVLEVQQDEGSGWETVTTGRVTGVRLGQRPTQYVIEFQDERYIERTTDIFTEAGAVYGSASQYAHTRLLPMGMVGDYGEYGIDSYTNPFAFAAPPTKTGNFVELRIDRYSGFQGFSGVASLTHVNLIRAFPQIAEILDGDLKDDVRSATSSTVGNYRHLRANVDGTDREVLGFFTFAGGFFDPNGIIKAVAEGRITETAVPVFVYWPAYTSGTPTNVWLHMPTAPPTPDLPMLIGGKDGIHPFQLLKDIYDTFGVRYDATAMQARIDDNRYGTVRLRITSKANLAEWGEEHIYQPYMCVPLIDDFGRIAPTPITLPVNLDPDTLFEFDGTTTAQPPPTWGHDVPTQVTVCKFVWESEQFVPLDTELGGEALAQRWANARPGLDLLSVSDRDFELSATGRDLLTPYGRHVREYRITGRHTKGYQLPVRGDYWVGALRLARWITREITDRAGDGIIRGNIAGLSASGSVGPGDYVKVNLSMFPNLGTGVRGGTYVLQTLAKRRKPQSTGGLGAYVFGYMGAGPANQPPSPPTVAVSATGKHSLDITISGLAAGDSYVCQMAMSASEPGGTSPLWQFVGDGDANETFAVEGLRSGTKFYVRAQAAAPNAFRSDWSASDNATTTALTAPSGAAISNITGTTAEGDWTNGETDYPIEVLLDAAACAGATLQVIDSLMPGSTFYELEGLDLSTTHCFGVRHRDPYGGSSATATAEFTTTATKPVCPEPAGIVVVG